MWERCRFRLAGLKLRKPRSGSGRGRRPGRQVCRFAAAVPWPRTGAVRRWSAASRKAGLLPECKPPLTHRLLFEPLRCERPDAVGDPSGPRLFEVAHTRPLEIRATCRSCPASQAVGSCRTAYCQGTQPGLCPGVADKVRGSFGDRHHRRLGAATGNDRDYRRVGHAKPAGADDLEVGIDHAADRRGTARVKVCRAMFADKSYFVPMR
jgi:hypothetical protein